MKKFGLIIFSLVSLFMFTSNALAITCTYTGKSGDKSVNAVLEINDKGEITKVSGDKALPVYGSQYSKIKNEVADTQTCPKYSFVGNNAMIYLYTDKATMEKDFDDGYGQYKLAVSQSASTEEEEKPKEEKKKEVETDDCGGVFGKSVDDPQYFAYYLYHAFQIMKFLGPILVVVMSILDLVKITAESKQDDQLQKLGVKTIKRLLYAGLIFVLPDLINYIFGLVGLYGTCGIS